MEYLVTAFVYQIRVVVIMKETMSSGLDAWLWQRISSIFLTLYILPILLFWLLTAASWHDWQVFLFAPSMRILGGLASVSLLLHACIGIWVVATDYIQIDRIQQVVLSFFYVVTVLSSIVMMVSLWSPV